MKGKKVVMPEKLWNLTIQLAHKGQQRMVRTKSRLREKVWWPDLDKKIEKFIRACYPCQLVEPRTKPEPIRSTPLPRGPWSEIERFLEYLAIDHKKGIPYWLQSNGEVERFNKTLLTIIRIAQLQGKRCSTLHTVT